MYKDSNLAIRKLICFGGKMPEEDILERIDTLALSIAESRQKNLLLLYYPEEGGEIKITDISDI